MKLFQFKRSAERDPFAIPRSVQRSIPIKRIYKDGIFEVSGKFSKTWRFFDVNYKVASLDKQMDHVSNAPPGQGLIKVGGSIVPFVNEFPKDTSLYKLMTTKPGEG